MQNWLVIRTRPRWEKKVAKRLFEQGVETFCPLVKEQRQWSDRVKTIEVPLFKSCLFIRVGEEQRTAVRLTEGVINFVYKSGKLAVLKEKQMQHIRQFQSEHARIQVVEDNGQVLKHLSAKGNSKAKTAILPIDTLNILLVAANGTSIPLKAATDK